MAPGDREAGGARVSVCAPGTLEWMDSSARASTRVDRDQDHRRRGDREIEAVVLAQPDDVEAELVGEGGVADAIVEAARRREGPTRLRVGPDVAERADAEVHGRCSPRIRGARAGLSGDRPAPQGVSR